MDSAFFSDEIVMALEEASIEFTVSVPFERFVELKKKIEAPQAVDAAERHDVLFRGVVETALLEAAVPLLVHPHAGQASAEGADPVGPLPAARIRLRFQGRGDQQDAFAARRWWPSTRDAARRKASSAN